MKYFLKSLKWTKNDGVTTWWKPNENGYTTLIAKAGVYSEEDIKRITSRLSKGDSEAISITQDVWEFAIKQLEIIDTELSAERIDITTRYNRNLAEIQKKQDKNGIEFVNMYRLARELGH